jgi:hypothetical protein
MIVRWGQLALALLLAGADAAHANDGLVTWIDPIWDAVPRTTDSQRAGLIGPGARLPDLLRATLSAWQSPTPFLNPYNGSIVDDPAQAHLFRLDLVFDGVLNPPGQLSQGEFPPYDPFMFGPSPLYGFFEIDVDGPGTGGELGTGSGSTYLANVGRFGLLPAGPVWDRALRWGEDAAQGFGLAPNYRASGADFVVALCGCTQPEIVSEDGNHDHRFDAGETWIIRGPFLRRTGGYEEASFCFGGSSGVPGAYDPLVNLRFSHSPATNQTTVTLVYALDMIGAGQLAGQAAEEPNYIVSDQNSIEEALQDVIDYVSLFTPPWPTSVLAQPWAGRNVRDYLDPTQWRMTALVGTASATQVDSPYIWTDTGFGEVVGDLDNDGVADSRDRAELVHQIIMEDAGVRDAEGRYIDNGQVQIRDFGANFCVYDLNNDGLINDADVNWYCTADFDRDGRLSVNDFSVFINAFVSRNPRADLNHSGSFEINDILLFGNAFAAGCP